MQTFSQKEHQKFKNYFNIKNDLSEIDKVLFDKTYKYIPYIKWIPWIKFVWVWNSTSMFASNKDSDIDLFIITSPKRMWIVRILTTLIFGLLWVRKTNKFHAKRFCLSLFSTTDWMNFKDFALENDIYLYFRIIYLKPILDFNNTFNAFLASQTWSDFSGYKNIIEENKKFIKFLWFSFWDNSKILDFVDNILEKIFLPKTIKSFELLWKPYGIIINKNMLKFHNCDKRKQIKKELLD